ncbi:PTS sugar transporter subunit IIA [Endozoicomonas sp. GU-1]|uniref:PTS sugar transporter subunit IIA n=1 Tax=Endozoicomonas sp. GU-1 TaxID=3009078 RepID=UPI0022B2F68E|nr:PTS sugar transporter subunit IIA [Endozoicomonas sp. GU-1]WBA88479.1 PTS sugar transporter subunit IIA [Endozoicomonas sp. GU-1]
MTGCTGPAKRKSWNLSLNASAAKPPKINAKELFEALVARERLGTTGLGDGVAIPHCRCKACPEPIGLFIRLAEPVDFDAVDREPVDLVFALIVPEGENQEHLEILRALAGRFHSALTLQKIRSATNTTMLYRTMSEQ